MAFFAQKPTPTSLTFSASRSFGILSSHLRSEKYAAFTSFEIRGNLDYGIARFECTHGVHYANVTASCNLNRAIVMLMTNVVHETRNTHTENRIYCGIYNYELVPGKFVVTMMINKTMG